MVSLLILTLIVVVFISCLMYESYKKDQGF